MLKAVPPPPPPPPTARTKVVGRKGAIALGIICVILAVSLGITAFSLNSQINSLNSQIINLRNQIVAKNYTISSLNSQIASLNSQINSLNSRITSLQDQITSLQNQVNDLKEIINLEKSKTWVVRQTVSQPARSYTHWSFSTDYAGYIVVTVHSSTTDNTYVRVTWSSYGIRYDNTITVGVSGTAVFPVLPCSNVEVRVGNLNLLSGATETVTITYYY
jgi:chaperonin cofactor prefoldin